jgi:hypothetical protein
MLVLDDERSSAIDVELEPLRRPLQERLIDDYRDSRYY